MNQLVQVILANGQVVTTTLAAIQQQQQQQQTAAAVQQFVNQQQQQQSGQLSSQQVQQHNQQQASPHVTAAGTAQLIANSNNQPCHMFTTFAGQQVLAQPASAPTTAQLVYNPATGQTQVLQFAAMPDNSHQQQQQSQQQIVIPAGHQFINQTVLMQQQQQQQHLQQHQLQQLINQNKINVHQQQQQLQQQQQIPAAQILQLVNQLPGGGGGAHNLQNCQVLVNPATGQIVGQLAPQSFNLSAMQMMPATLNGQQLITHQGIAVQQQQPSPTVVQVQTQQQASALTPQPTQQQQQQLLQVLPSGRSEGDATRLHVQRVIQQQQQQILQQQRQQAQQQHNHRQAHVNVLIEQRKHQQQQHQEQQAKVGSEVVVMKVLSPPGRVSSSTTTAGAAAAVAALTAAAAAVPVTVVSKRKHQPPLILPAAAAVIPSQTKAPATGTATAFHVVTNPVVEGRVRETILPDAGVRDHEEDAEDADAGGGDSGDGGDEDEDSSQTSLSSTPSSCSRMEPESTTHSDSSSQATIAHTINTSNARIVDGVNLEDVQEFARSFKMRRLQLGMTQTQVGNALALSQGPTYSQSAICRFEKLEISPKSALKIMPVLKEWMAEAEKLHQNGQLTMTDIIGSDSGKKRKRRTTFATAATEHLNYFFSEVTQHPDSAQMTELADKLNYDREVIRVWFCNRRQALKKVLNKSVSNSIKHAVADFESRDNGATKNAVIPVS